jgi:hypothetical protein
MIKISVVDPDPVDPQLNCLLIADTDPDPVPAGFVKNQKSFRKKFNILKYLMVKYIFNTYFF